MPKVRVNGVSLQYEVLGKGRETIVFSHSLLFDKTVFANQVDFFKNKYRCIYYDHRGQGESQITKQGYDVDNLTKDCLGLMDALHIEKCHFVGLAMGGYIGMRLAARYPERIQSLILLETSANAEKKLLKYKLMAWTVRLFGTKPMVNKMMKIFFGQKFLNDSSRKEEREKWRRYFASHKKSIVRSVEGVLNRKSMLDELSNIKAPTLVIVGDEDVNVEPANIQQIHKKIANCQLVTIGGAGRCSTIEEPEQVNQAIEGFLNAL